MDRNEENDEDISYGNCRKFRIILLLAAIVLLLTGTWTIRAGAATRYYGSQLTGRAREVYDTLAGNSTAQMRKFYQNKTTIRFPAAATLRETLLGETAYLYDYPEIYWIWGFDYDLADSGMVTGVRISDAMDCYETIGSDLKKTDAALKKAIKYVKKKKGRYAKVKAAHDYICKLVEYGQSSKQPNACATISGILSRNGKNLICDGYAKLFQAICLANNIPCIYVHGTALGQDHAWNYVKMTDGKWYLVDVTWDDGSKISSDYLLVGSETKVDGRKVKTSHTVDTTSTKFIGTITVDLPVPKLSRTAYKNKK